jgi:hypothetical protein
MPSALLPPKPMLPVNPSRVLKACPMPGWRQSMKNKTDAESDAQQAIRSTQAAAKLMSTS